MMSCVLGIQAGQLVAQCGLAQGIEICHVIYHVIISRSGSIQAVKHEHELIHVQLHLRSTLSKEHHIIMPPSVRET